MIERAHIADIVRAGLLAPSGDNCQPWRFVWNGRDLEIRFLPERAESLYDVRDAASWIALGATLMNMRLAAAALGWELCPQLFPQESRQHVAATIQLQPRAPIRDPLAEAILARCVNRRSYRNAPLSRDDRVALTASVEGAAGVRLDLVEDRAVIAQLARLAARSDRLLFENRALHAGLFRWLRWTAQEAKRTGDGLPIGSLELHPAERAGFRLLASWPSTRLLGWVGLTRCLSMRTQRTYERSAAIGLLSVADSRAETFVQGGEVLERLWLTAASKAIAFQPIAGMTLLWLRCRLVQGDGLSRAHQRLVEETGAAMARWLPGLRDRTPIMLFRIGQAPPPTQRTQRRPLEEILTMVTS